MPGIWQKASKKMNTIKNAALVKKYQKISLRYMRREIAILAIEDNSEKGRLWNSLRRERNRQYRLLFNNLLERGIEPSSVPVFEI